MRPSRFRRAVILPLLALLTLSVGCHKVRARITIREGNTLFKAEKFERAIEKYEAALLEDPSLTRTYRNIGLAYMAMFQPASQSPKDKMYADKAIEFFKKFIEAYPTDPKGPDYLVSMYLSASRFDQAIEHFQSVLSNTPNDLQTIQRIALVYQKKGDFDNAYKWRQEQAKLVTTEAEKAEAWYTIGVLCWDRSYNYPDLEPTYRQGVIDKGVEALNEAITHREKYFEAIAYLNLLFREKAKYEWDPAKKQEYTIQANQYMMQALEMRKAAARTAAAIPATAATAAN